MPDEPTRQQTLRRCSSCELEKPVSGFYLRTTGRAAGKPRRICKDCHKAANRSRPRHPESRMAIMIRTIKRFYGLDADQYAAMLEAQQNRCIICREHATEGRPLEIDHDHSCCSGRYACGRCNRGLICHRCNLLVAWAKDSAAVLRNAAEYLSAWEASRVTANR